MPVPAWPCEYVDLHPFLCIPWRKGCFCLSGCVLIGAYTVGEASVPAGKNGTAGEMPLAKTGMHRGLCPVRSK